jgi:uncharacterized protein YerC
MKRRTQDNPDKADDTEARLEALALALSALDGAEAFQAFLTDLCTPAELGR